MQGSDPDCLAGGGGSGEIHSHEIKWCVTARGVLLSAWITETASALFFVATPNLLERYYRATDHMKIGTGKLQRLFLSMFSSFLHVSNMFMQYLIYIL